MSKENDQKLNYKDAGVDIDAGNELVKKIKPIVASTFRPEVLSDIGGFGALFDFNKDKYEEPVLISATDGVGTKLKIAFMADKHDTVGIDLVAMSVNDLIVQGAEPLFFLDYFASGKLEIDVAAGVVSGIAEGCKQAGCALIGGETAEMPSMYVEGEYDLAGFAVGAVDKKNLITGKNIKKGDVLIGFASSGLHSNGYSLARKIIFEKQGLSIKDELFDNKTVGEILLTPTKIYVKSVLGIMKHIVIKGISHITGGGFKENIKRILPEGLDFELQKDSFPILPVFKYLQDAGNVETKEMFRVFNMGIGLVLVVDAEDVSSVLKKAEELGQEAYCIGKVVCNSN
jgi:phosphoribosylformylglycinamidine cyclo-ligase